MEKYEYVRRFSSRKLIFDKCTYYVLAKYEIVVKAKKKGEPLEENICGKAAKYVKNKICYMLLFDV